MSLLEDIADSARVWRKYGVKAAKTRLLWETWLYYAKDDPLFNDFVKTHMNHGVDFRLFTRSRNHKDGDGNAVYPDVDVDMSSGEKILKDLLGYRAREVEAKKMLDIYMRKAWPVYSGSSRGLLAEAYGQSKNALFREAGRSQWQTVDTEPA